MITNPSTLWLLGLILCCCCKFQSNSIEIKISKHPQNIKTSVDLKCETSHADGGVFWMFQQRDHTMHFVLYVSARSKVTPGSVSGYLASKNGNYYNLNIPNFEEENQGIYYCIVHHNQVLIFSSGLPVYLPETTTIKVPHQISTTSKGQVTEESMECQNPTISDEGPVFPCELYIWVPLVGGCCILLISLVITISLCSAPRRRRRCRCKRPMNGANGAVPLSR